MEGSSQRIKAGCTSAAELVEPFVIALNLIE
jgi:hypothetical protein